MIRYAFDGINHNLRRKEHIVTGTVSFLCLLSVLFAASRPSTAEEPRTLDIYFLDMVGGASTLLVTPLGESVLIDTGSLRPEHRDADRILKACQDAGLQQIDYLVTTHFHSDHFGAILEVSQRIPVKCFMDKGTRAPAGDGDNRWSKDLYALYEQATKGSVKTLRAGDDIPLRNDPAGKFPKLTLHCVTADKKVEGFDGDVDAPVDGLKIERADGSDNARSIALLLAYGNFKFFAGGDITWNVEQQLVHPTNRLGKVDLYQVTHHGLDLSNNTLLLKALDPTVAVALNGPRKGIQPRTFQDLAALPGLKALYQIHFNTEHDGQYNTKPELIANPKDDPNKGQFIKACIHADEGTFAIQVGEDGPEHTYRFQFGG
jgi:competence protein ComEC